MGQKLDYRMCRVELQKIFGYCQALRSSSFEVVIYVHSPQSA